ncbi:MAG: hypothetical protein NZ521_02065, partial [Flammeovirgaceae bacterium]|nr:hypothetical protein [Flammeovirgaceae bacterium]
MKKYLYFAKTATLWLSCFFGLSAQDIPIGHWRNHAAYHSLRNVTLNEEEIFCASQQGLFSYHLIDKTITVYSKATGDLSDVVIGAIAFHTPSQTLIIGYDNGNIDLWKENEITNIQTLLNANLPNKSIEYIFLHGNIAYLTGGFGLAELNILQKRIVASYTHIGANGTPVKAFACTIYRDSLFVATQQGLLATSLLPTVNRQDFNKWRSILSVSNNLQHVAVLNDAIYFTIEKDGLYRYRQGSIQKMSLASGQSYKGLFTQNNQLHFFTENTFYLLEANGSITKILENFLKAPRQAILKNNLIVVADQKRGLVVQQGNNPPASIFPNGIYTNTFERLYAENQKVIGISSAMSIWENGFWKNFTAEENFIQTTVLPSNSLLKGVAFEGESKGYLATYGDGIFEWNISNNEYKKLNEGLVPNSEGKILLTDVSFSTIDKRAMVLQWGENGGVFARNAQRWQKLELSTPLAAYLTSITEDDIGQKWAIVDEKMGGGILVFKNNGTFRWLTVGQGKGNLTSQQVHTIAKDLKGSIWIGTARGISVFYNPADVLSNRPSDAVEPRFQNRRLLQNETVTAIAVDGGNRKWIGTQNGAWLFSPEGSRLIHHFTEKNSPLPSNHILSIAIEGRSGEVFFATQTGVVSFRSDATEASNTFAQVKVFPNPVRPDFSGTIAIEGLLRDAVVKITDINGRLIWQTTSKGGTATWNGRDQDG